MRHFMHVVNVVGIMLAAILWIEESLRNGFSIITVRHAERIKNGTIMK